MRFRLKRIVLVGDRGMITQARIDTDIEPAGFDWITALRAPTVQALAAEGGPLQLSLFDERDMAEIASDDYPGERLIVCRNPELAAERARKRAELIDATEKALAKIRAATERKRNPLRGKDKIGLRVGAVIDRRHRAKHFELAITDTSFAWSRKADAIAAEAALDGICESIRGPRRAASTTRASWAAAVSPTMKSVGKPDALIGHVRFDVIRSNLPHDGFPAAAIVLAYKGLSHAERGFRDIKSGDLDVRPIHHRRAHRVRAHVFLCMLAYYVLWHMKRDLAPMLFKDDNPAAAASCLRRSESARKFLRPLASILRPAYLARDRLTHCEHLNTRLSNALADPEPIGPPFWTPKKTLDAKSWHYPNIRAWISRVRLEPAPAVRSRPPVSARKIPFPGRRSDNLLSLRQSGSSTPPYPTASVRRIC